MLLNMLTTKSQERFTFVFEHPAVEPLHILPILNQSNSIISNEIQAFKHHVTLKILFRPPAINILIIK